MLPDLYPRRVQFLCRKIGTVLQVKTATQSPLYCCVLQMYFVTTLSFSTSLDVGGYWAKLVSIVVLIVYLCLHTMFPYVGQFCQQSLSVFV